jgi:hypothetical protein
VSWVIVLIKGFESAKQRLSAAMDAPQRAQLALRNAELALAAVPLGCRPLAVAGSPAAPMRSSCDPPAR